MEQQPTYQQLLNINRELRWQLEEANDAIAAIRTGQVDALIVDNADGPQLYTLKSADQTYRVFIEKMNEGAVTVNREGLILYSNTKFAQLTGRPLENVIGYNFRDFVIPADADTFNAVIESSWEKDCKAELCIHHDDLGEIPCLISCNAMEFDGGTALSLIITDLSIQKEIQKQLETQFDRLEEAQGLTQTLNDELEETVKTRTRDLTISQDYLKLLTNNIPQMTWTNQPGGEVTFYNQRWYDYTGLTLAQSQNLGWQAVVHPDDVALVNERYQNAEQKGYFEVECRYRNTEGSYRWHLNRSVPLRDKDGKILFWVGSATDIELQKQEMDKKDEFIGIASHELKTPLTSLKGYLQIMDIYKKEQVPPAVKQYVAKANLAVNKLQHLVNDLLDVSKIQAGRLEYPMDNINLDAMLNAAVESAAHIFPDNRFEHEIEKNLTAYGNAERLEQVLMNFVSNANKYAKDGSRVIINARVQDGKVRVSVTDEGIGLYPEQQDKIFERFYRVEDKMYSASGLGMGLYISAEIIKHHKGIIKVESEPGKGSTFSFELPLL